MRPPELAPQRLTHLRRGRTVVRLAKAAAGAAATVRRADLVPAEGPAVVLEVPEAVVAAEEILPPQEGLQVLRREDRRHQLQGRPVAVRICVRGWEDRASPPDRGVHTAPTALGRRHQAGAQHRAAAVRGKIEAVDQGLGIRDWLRRARLKTCADTEGIYEVASSTLLPAVEAKGVKSKPRKK